MNYKIQGAIKRNKTNFIICVILWLFLTIVFIAPISYSIFQASATGKFDLNSFMGVFGQNITNPFGTLGNVFSTDALQGFFSNLFGFTIFYLIFFFIGFVRSAPKNEFTDIEHGSSDWSQKGEQYEILNRNRGIILAEDNCLPVDKRGNVNVLVVGRIWIW